MCWEKAEGRFTAWMGRRFEEERPPEDVELREVADEPEEELGETPEREKVLEHV